MSLSIKKISALSQDQQTEKVQTGKNVYFRANTGNTLAEDTFESGNKSKKKKIAKIVGWTLALAAAIVAAVLYKKGKALETAGKKIGAEASDVADTAGKKVVAGASDAAENVSPKLENEISAAKAENKVGENVAGTEQQVVEDVADVVPAAEKVGENAAGTEQQVGENVADVVPAAEEAVENVIEVAPAADENAVKKVADVVPAAEENVAEKSKTKKRPIRTWFKKVFERKTKKTKEPIPKPKTEAEKLVEKKKMEINAMLDRTIPEIPQEIKTIKIEHQNATEHFKALTGMSLEEIKEIPISEYKEFGNDISYVIELPDERKLSIVRDGAKNAIDRMCIYGPHNARETFISIYPDSSIRINDEVKSIVHDYHADGEIIGIIIKKPNAGEYHYNSGGKLVGFVEIPDSKTSVCRKIDIDADTGEILNVTYRNANEFKWYKVEYFKDGKIEREYFNDELLK